MYLFAVFINSGMVVLEEHFLVAAPVYNPYRFCVMRHVTIIALFSMILGLKFIA